LNGSFVQRVTGGKAAGQIGHNDSESRVLVADFDCDRVAHGDLLYSSLFTDGGNQAFAEALFGVRHTVT
jgi:hypothetical protein